MVRTDFLRYHGRTHFDVKVSRLIVADIFVILIAHPAKKRRATVNEP